MEAYTVQYRVKSKKQSKYLDGLMHWWPDVPRAMLIEEKGRRIETFDIPRQVLAPQSEIESRLHYIIIDQPHNAAAQLAVAAAAPLPPPPILGAVTPFGRVGSGGLPTTALVTPGAIGVRRIGLSSARSGAAPGFRTPLLRSRSSIAAPESPAPTMPRVKFIVLWTDQKQKKHKTWNDGHCVLTENGKLVLYSENDRRLDSLFCKKPPQVGDELEFDFHLVTISEAIGAGHSVTAAAAVAQPTLPPPAARAPGLDVSPVPPPGRIQWPKFSTPLKAAGSGGRDDGGQAATRADSLGPDQALTETQAAPASRRVPARRTPSLDARTNSTAECASTSDTVDDAACSQSKKLSAPAVNRQWRRTAAAVDAPKPATPCPNDSSSKTQFRQLPTPSTAEKPLSDGGFSIGRPPRKILRPSSVRSVEDLAQSPRLPSPPLHLDMMDAAPHAPVPVAPPPPVPEPRPPVHVPPPPGPDLPTAEYSVRTHTSTVLQRPGAATGPPAQHLWGVSRPAAASAPAPGAAAAHDLAFSAHPLVPAPHGPPANAAGPAPPPPPPPPSALRPPTRTIDTIRRAHARAGASSGGNAESRQIVSFTPKSLKFRALHRKPQRLLKLPDTFPTVQQYRTLFTSAVYESLQAQVASVANDYFRVYNALTNNGKTQVDPDKLEAAVRRKGIALHTGVKVTRAFGSLSLILGSKYGSYGKDDLWVVANTPYFGYATFLRSTFFGVSQLSVDVAPLNPPMNPSQDSLYFAIRLFTCNELSQVANLESFGPQTTPAFPLLLNFAKYAPPPDSDMADFVPEIPNDEYYDIAHRLAVQYALNECQTAVLMSWARKLKTQATSVTLVHGVFGSGKSHLVTVLVLFFSKVLAQRLTAAAASGGGASDAVAADYRVLVSSNTNVAVDRILEGLLGKGFSDFVRVGNLKKMSKLVLPHAAANKNQEGLRDLSEQLARATSDRDRDLIRTAMERLGGSHLARARVVGATCLATLLECMDQERFGMVILDECSQMTEPLSLLPLRLGAKHVVCVGDPKQLPPTLESDCPHRDHLEKTIFERLARAGCPVQVLREQYRCHEDISAIANSLFYDGHLINGTHVPNGIDNLPTVVFVDVSGTEQRCSRTNSFYNVAEARELVHFYHILTHGPGRNALPGVPRLHVPASDVGIITLYRGQVEALRGMLKEPGGSALGLAPVRHSTGGDDETDGPDTVSVNTVDAFQGSEKRVILVSCVRSANVGFSDDARRINVMLTRARHHLVMFGHRALLSRSPLWAQVLQRCHCVSAREFRGMIPRMVAAHDWHEMVVDEDEAKSDDDFVKSPRRRRPVPGPAAATPAPAPPRMFRPADPAAQGPLPVTKKRHAEDAEDDEGPSLVRKRPRESFFMDPTESDSDHERDEPLATGMLQFSTTNPPRIVMRPTAIKNLGADLFPEDVIMDEALEMAEMPSATFHDDGFGDEMLLAIPTPREPVPLVADAAEWDVDERGAVEWDAAAAEWDADPAPRVDAGGDALMTDFDAAALPPDPAGMEDAVVEDPVQEPHRVDALLHDCTAPPVHYAAAADAPTNWEAELDTWMQEDDSLWPARTAAADPGSDMGWEAEADAWMRDVGNPVDAVAPAAPAVSSTVTSADATPGDDTDWDDLERMYAEMGGE